MEGGELQPRANITISPAVAFTNFWIPIVSKGATLGVSQGVQGLQQWGPHVERYGPHMKEKQRGSEVPK